MSVMYFVTKHGWFKSIVSFCILLLYTEKLLSVWMLCKYLHRHASCDDEINLRFQNILQVSSQWRKVVTVGS